MPRAARQHRTTTNYSATAMGTKFLGLGLALQSGAAAPNRFCLLAPGDEVSYPSFMAFLPQGGDYDWGPKIGEAVAPYGFTVVSQDCVSNPAFNQSISLCFADLDPEQESPWVVLSYPTDVNRTEYAEVETEFATKLCEEDEELRAEQCGHCGVEAGAIAGSIIGGFALVWAMVQCRKRWSEKSSASVADAEALLPVGRGYGAIAQAAAGSDLSEAPRSSVPSIVRFFGCGRSRQRAEASAPAASASHAVPEVVKAGETRFSPLPV